MTIFESTTKILIFYATFLVLAMSLATHFGLWDITNNLQYALEAKRCLVKTFFMLFRGENLFSSNNVEKFIPNQFNDIFMNSGNLELTFYSEVVFAERRYWCCKNIPFICTLLFKVDCSEHKCLFNTILKICFLSLLLHKASSFWKYSHHSVLSCSTVQR